MLVVNEREEGIMAIYPLNETLETCSRLESVPKTHYIIGVM